MVLLCCIGAADYAVSSSIIIISMAIGIAQEIIIVSRQLLQEPLPAASLSDTVSSTASTASAMVITLIKLSMDTKMRDLGRSTLRAVVFDNYHQHGYRYRPGD